jgi:hypothetical protein
MKTLKFLLINLFIRDHRKTLEIINGLDGTPKNIPSQKKLPKQKKVYGDMSSLLLTVEDNDDVFVEPIKVLKPKSKRDELLEGLNYLKSKKIKTVKDKESIYTLELLLKS